MKNYQDEIASSFHELCPDFDAETIRTVGAVATEAYNSSPEDFTNRYLTDAKALELSTHCASLRVLDIPSRLTEGADPAAATIILPQFRHDIDEARERVRLAWFAAACPDTRIIAVANPDGSENESGHLSSEHRSVMAAGELGPLLEPLLEYIAKQDIKVINCLGFSLGATEALDLAARAERYGIAVGNVVAVEATDLRRQTLVGLGRSFRATRGTTEGQLPKHAPAVHNQAALDKRRAGRKDGKSFGATNMSIARMLTRGVSACNIARLLADNPDAHITLAHATGSEHVRPRVIRRLMARATKQHGQLIQSRLTELTIQGRHQMCSNPELSAALFIRATGRAAIAGANFQVA